MLLDGGRSQIGSVKAARAGLAGNGAPKYSVLRRILPSST